MLRRAGYVLGTVAVVCGLGYLIWYNPHPVEVRLSSERSFQAPLAAHLIFALVLGAGVVLVANGLRGSQRAVVEWRRRRKARRDARLQALADDGRKLLWAGEVDRARSSLLRVHRLRPTRETLLAVVDAFLDAEQPQEARRYLQAPETKFADDPESLCALADACERSGDTAGAISALERARSRHPRSLRLLRRLRDLYQRAGRWTEAATAHSEWLAVRARTASSADEAMLAGLRCEAALAVPGQAARLQALEEVATQFPRFVPAAVALGDALLAAERPADAVRIWEQAFRQRPSTVLADRLTEAAHDRSGRDRVRSLLRKARGEHLDEDAVHLAAARLWLEDGQGDLAGRELDAVSAAGRGTDSYLAIRARLCEIQGDTAGALSAYQQLCEHRAPFLCSRCGRPTRNWETRCGGCGAWGGLRAPVDFFAD